MSNNQSSIAVIGLNCRFPGANTVDAFWNMLWEGIAPLNQINKSLLQDKNQIPVNIRVQDVDCFDADFFGYTHREAEVMDPQQRTFLQLGWEVLEIAGYNPFDYSGLIGIFAGASTSTYLINHLLNHPVLKSIGEFQSSIYNEKDYLTSLLAFHLNLKGPVVTVQSSCSTSLVAIHMACESLLSGQCDMALAGGITLTFPAEDHYTYQEGGLVSTDGHIASFDASASGTVYSNGAGIVLLKRLEDAIRDGDQIISVIRGTAINNDGATRMSFSAPGVEGQSLVITEALALANIPPESISYIETHGSGTPLGDSIEFEAMTKAFRESTDKEKFCAIGSVKTNIGHTQVAAGIAGFIKTCLSLQYRKLPPSLNFEKPNPKCHFDNSPFYVNKEAIEWKITEGPRRACVNSFGLGGSNAHIVLEEYIQSKQREKINIFPDICLISAKTDFALKELCMKYRQWIDIHPNLNLNDFAFTTRVGRKVFPKRIAITFSSREDLISQLEEVCDNSSFPTVQKPTSLFIQLEADHLANPTDLQAVLMSFSALTPLATEIAALNLQNLKNEDRYIFNSIILVKLLQKFNIVWDGFIVDELSQSFVNYLDPFIPIQNLFWNFKSGIASQSNLKIIDIHSIDNVDRWKEENNRLIIDLKSIHLFPNLPLRNGILRWLAKLWLQGMSLDWSIIQIQENLHRLSLPTYPFDAKRYFVDRLDIRKDKSVIEISNDERTGIIEIWEDVMGLKIHDIFDNFFEQGGHSLLATQLLFTIEKKFDKRISLQSFLEDPTVHGLIQCATAIKTTNATAFSEITPDGIHQYEPFPLTDIQQAYWIGRHSELELGNIATHMYLENDLIDLDLKRFELALNKCIERHAMLRAVILDNGTQKILQKVDPYKIIYHDLSSETKESQKDRLYSIRKEMSHELIDTKTWPLFRVVACKKNARVTRLQISIDLLILDAWSIELWLKELGEIYQNPLLEIPPLKLSFRDYVLAMKEIERSPLFEISRNYWLKRIQEGLSPAPQLPFAKAPSLINTPHFKRHKGFISQKNWEVIKEIGKKFNVTPPVILIGAFSEILRLWSTNKNFTLNLTMFNRLPLHAQVNEVLGDFTSLTLLEISDLKNNSFVDRLKNIQMRVWQDLEHRYFSAPQVTKELMKNSESSNHHFPIVFTSLLNQNSINSSQTSPFKIDLTNDEEAYSVSQTPQVWLDHQVMEKDDGIHFNWDVVEELFPENLIEVMFQSYCSFLEKLATTPSSWEENDIVRTHSSLNEIVFPNRNDPKQQVSNNLLFSDFLKWVKKVPEQIAIVTPSVSLTYEEVEKLSRQVAQQLQKENINPGEMIAVAINKGWEMVVIIIGILRAGGAYLPIDMELPLRAIHDRLSLSQAKIVICEHNTTISSQHTGQRLIQIKFNHDFSQQTDLLFSESYSNNQLAYGFFTSGSTGQPKCVEITHIAAVNTIEAVNTEYKVTSKDTVLSLSSFSFDLSVYDIFGLLSVGGKIVIPDIEQAKDPEAWKKLIEENCVTVWNTVPAFMQMFHAYICNSEQENVLKQLRVVMLSGDKIPVRLATEIKETYPLLELVSLGGATEAGIWSIWYDIRGNEQQLNSIPYGKAMPNQQFYVLDDHLQECPLWIDGELFIGGVGLALGYRNNLEETKTRFIVHPTLGRIYNTGDRGRYMNNGLIEFLGRQDSQVKIRGHRIELGEIEAKLNQHESVKSSVVIIEQNENDQKDLVAFIELQPGYTNFQSLPEGILTDPIDRLQFKISEHCYRKDVDTGIQLSNNVEANLEKSFLHRRSYRQFLDKPIQFEQLETLLSHLRSIEMPGLPFGKRLYGSGGGLYPVQTYVYIKNKIGHLIEGFYYYQPKLNRLNFLHRSLDLTPLFSPNNRELLKNANFTIFLTANYDAIVPMYGKEESQKMIFIEVGLITQLLEMVATTHKVGLCQVGGIDVEKIKSYLSLAVNNEIIHCLVGGSINEEQLTLHGLIKDMDSYHANERIVLDETPINPIETIREFLSCQLPDYMVPANLYTVPSIPLTANGKLDRKACISLKGPTNLRDPNVKACQVPIPNRNMNLINTEIETELTNIWRDALPDKQFSPTDHFFDVGGNSISLVHVYRHIQSKFSKKVTMADLFRNPTIRALSNFLDQIENKLDVSLIHEEENRASARREALRKKKENSLR